MDRRQGLKAIVGGAVLGASGGLWTRGFAAEPIKVGAIFPLSGGAGPQGQHVTAAIKTMASIINTEGGVLGRPIVVVARDDESTPAVGVSRATELISDGVAVIIEGWNSPVTLAMQPVIARAGVLDITAVSKADEILSGKGNPLAVRMNSSNAQDGFVLANYIAKMAKPKSIAFLTENDAYGIGAQKALEQDLEKIGYQYKKVAEEKFPFSQTDFRVAMTSVAAAMPNVTVAIDANEGVGMPALIRQARQSRVQGKLVTAVGTISPSVISVAGAAADGIIGADIYFPDVEPFSSNPVNQRFVSTMQADDKITPDKYMALGAISLQVWAMAANELKTLDREAIANRIRGGSFKHTIFGDTEFEPNGQKKSSFYLFTVENQKIVIIK